MHITACALKLRVSEILVFPISNGLQESTYCAALKRLVKCIISGTRLGNGTCNMYSATRERGRLAKVKSVKACAFQPISPFRFYLQRGAMYTVHNAF